MVQVYPSSQEGQAGADEEHSTHRLKMERPERAFTRG